MASKKPSLRGGKLVCKFIDEERNTWTLYEASGKTQPHLFGGAGAVGCTWPESRKIFLDVDQNEAERFDTIVHEIFHMALREVGMHEILEESFVEEMSRRVAYYLGQVLDR